MPVGGVLVRITRLLATFTGVRNPLETLSLTIPTENNSRLSCECGALRIVSGTLRRHLTNASVCEAAAAAILALSLEGEFLDKFGTASSHNIVKPDCRISAYTRQNYAIHRAFHNSECLKMF